MKKPFMLSLLSVFVLSIILSGCGWIKTEKEFSNWLDGYTDKEGQAHEGFQSKVDKADQALSDRVSELDGKVDEPTINSFVDNMLARDSMALRKHIKDNSPDIDLTQDIEIGGETVTVSIPLTVEFFWPSS